MAPSPEASLKVRRVPEWCICGIEHRQWDGSKDTFQGERWSAYAADGSPDPLESSSRLNGFAQENAVVQGLQILVLKQQGEKGI